MMETQCICLKDELNMNRVLVPLYPWSMLRSGLEAEALQQEVGAVWQLPNK